MKTLFILNDAPYGNLMLAMPQEAFVDAVTADIPPQLKDMNRIIEANLREIAPEVAHA